MSTVKDHASQSEHLNNEMRWDLLNANDGEMPIRSNQERAGVVPLFSTFLLPFVGIQKRFAVQ